MIDLVSPPSGLRQFLLTFSVNLAAKNHWFKGIKVALSWGLTSAEASTSQVESNRFTACLHADKR